MHINLIFHLGNKTSKGLEAKKLIILKYTGSAWLHKRSNRETDRREELKMKGK